MRGRVDFIEDRCKGCGICVQVCPRKIITMLERRNSRGHRLAGVERMQDCTGCAICAEMCPDSVIEVYRDSKTPAAPADGTDLTSAAKGGNLLG